MYRSIPYLIYLTLSREIAVFNIFSLFGSRYVPSYVFYLTMRSGSLKEREFESHGLGCRLFVKATSRATRRKMVLS